MDRCARCKSADREASVISVIDKAVICALCAIEEMNDARNVEQIERALHGPLEVSQSAASKAAHPVGDKGAVEK